MCWLRRWIKSMRVLPPKVSESEATEIARAFIAEHDIVAGEFQRVRHVPESELIMKVGVSSGHGDYMVFFAYAGPPIPHDPNRCVTPPLDSPVTIMVNDQTGVAKLFLRM